MKELHVLFPTKQHLQISDLVDNTKIKKSKVARAALQIGLEIIRKSDKREEVIAINDLKAQN